MVRWIACSAKKVVRRSPDLLTGDDGLDYKFTVSVLNLADFRSLYILNNGI